MTSETKGEHDSLHVSELIEALRLNWRLGDDAEADKIYRGELLPACRRWIKNGRSIPWQDAEDIASRAVELHLEDISSPSVPAEVASLRLKTALNTIRAEYMRRAAIEQGYGNFEAYEAAYRLYEEVDFEAHIDEEAEQARREQHLLKVVDRLHGYIEISLERLRPREYGILHDVYDLGEIGMAEPTEPSPLSDLKPGARRVAVCRARRRFLDELHGLLREACLSIRDEATVLEDVIRLIEGGHLADVLSVRRRQPN
jgi:hypothetical protein